MSAILSRAKSSNNAVTKAAVVVASDELETLTVFINRKQNRVPIAELHGAERNQLLTRCMQADSVTILLTRLLDLSDADRLPVLDFIARVPNANVQTKGTRHNDLLEAVLAVMENSLSLERTGRGKLAALEAAVLTRPEALDIACQRIGARMKELGLKATNLERDARRILKELSRPSPSMFAVLVSTVITDDPVAEESIVPPGWSLSMAGIESAAHPAIITTTPILIGGRFRDVQRDVELVTLLWFRDGRWLTKTVERKTIANKNAILELASHGLPVHSGNAGDLVQYLSDYEAANIEILPADHVSGQMGWQGPEGEDGFLWGANLITADGIWGSDSEERRPGVLFRGVDAGDEQLAAGFHSAGTFEAWKCAIQQIAEYPRVLLGFYASFVPPMLPILKTHNFAIDYSGPTSNGKTTTLKGCASVWGNPERSSAGGTALSDWNTTPTWRERAPAVMNHLPLILDDTKTARDGSEIHHTVYSFTQGRGRGRGTVQGLAQQVRFDSVLLSSGEQPLISFGEHGGTRARVLTLWGSPFGAIDEATGELVANLNRELAANYGYAGPEFVRHLIEKRNHWERIRQKFLEKSEEYATLAGTNHVAARLAIHLAAIWVASFSVHRALGLPWPWTDPIEPLWDELTRETVEADRAVAALRHAIGWAVAHPSEFVQRAPTNSNQPLNGWAGRWDRTSTIPFSEPTDSPWAPICFLPSVLRQILEEAGFEVDSTIRNWKDRGWIDCEEGRTQRKIRIGEMPTWAFVINHAGATEAGKI